MICKFTWPGTARGDIYLETPTADFNRSVSSADHIDVWTKDAGPVQMPRRGLEVYLLDGTTGKTIDRPRLPLPTGVGCPNE